MYVFKKLLKPVGIFAFWLTWPASYVYLRNSIRSRVLVICDDEILVTKSWLGDGSWTLPGGGVHDGENPVSGAARELREEIGLSVKPDGLRSIGRSAIINNGCKYQAVYYLVELTSKPVIVLQLLELSDARWVKFSQITGTGFGPDVREAIKLANFGSVD